MKKVIGIGFFMILLYVVLLRSDPGARKLNANLDLLVEIGLLGFLALGAGTLIVSGGIDLSIGSVAVLAATLQAYLIINGWHPLAALLLVIGMGCVIGLFHGLLVTQLRIQAFVVTLCGLFIYRGVARWIAGDLTLDIDANPETPSGEQFLFWKQWLSTGPVVYEEPGRKAGQFIARHLSMFPIFLFIVSAISYVFLHLSVHGRYLTAIGNNEKAVHYSGVKTTRYKIFAYVVCSCLSAFYGVLFTMKYNGVQASSAMMGLELFAIAAAVLGGCSLRGGEGTIPGMLIGACILPILRKVVSFYRVENAFVPTVIGLALLFGAILDEVLRRQRGARFQR